MTDLFNHRVGLSGNAGDDLKAVGLRSRRYLAAPGIILKPTSSFRAGYTYSNFGSNRRCRSLPPKPTGKSWEDVCRREAVQAARHEVEPALATADFLTP